MQEREKARLAARQHKAAIRAAKLAEQRALAGMPVDEEDFEVDGDGNRPRIVSSLRLSINHHMCGSRGLARLGKLGWGAGGGILISKPPWERRRPPRNLSRKCHVERFGLQEAKKEGGKAVKSARPGGGL